MADVTPISVLVIEDDADTRANLCDILELDNYRVETAGTVAQALRRETWSEYTAIILDRKLPDGTAEELLPRLKQLAPDAAVIVATGYADIEGAIAAIRLGAADYIPKPINPDVLRARLTRIAEARRSAQERARAEQRQATQYAVTRILAEAASITEAASELLHAIGEYMRCDLSELWCVDPASNTLRMEGMWFGPSLHAQRFEAVSRGTTFSLGTGLPGRVWACGQTVWVPDVTTDAAFHRASIADEVGLHGAIAVPIYRGNDVTAVMAFYCRKIGQPDDSLLQMLQSFCRQIGSFMERRLAQEALRRTKEELRRILASIADYLWSGEVDRSGKFTYLYYSPVVEQITGRPPDFYMGSPERWLSTIHTEDRPRLQDAYLRATSGEFPQVEEDYRIVLPDGMVRWVRDCVRVTKVADTGAIRLDGVVSDITQLREAQERLLQSERLAAIGQMMTGLAHESRNALQRSQACLEMIALDVQHMPETLEMVEDAQKAQDYLHHLYEEVRGYAAPIKLKRERCHLGELLDEVWLQLAIVREGRKAHLNQEENGLDLCCEVDRQSVGQVFRNILENALSACPDPVELRARWSEAETNGRTAVLISLRDNGPGLTLEARRKIFEPFFTTKTQGTGLGMAIAKRIVEAHGGQIELGPDSVRGAEIQIRLPRATTSRQAGGKETWIDRCASP